MKTNRSVLAAAVTAGNNKANTPEEALQLLGERIVAKDIDGILALHEPQATIVHFDGSLITGYDKLRVFYSEWFNSNPVLTVNPLQVVVAGGDKRGYGKLRNRSASVVGSYSLSQDAADGTRQTFTGKFIDIIAEQPNGTWLYVLDNPYPPF